MMAHVAGEPASLRAEEFVAPSATLQPDERLDIYRRMYPLRMQEAMGMDYPATLELLGWKAFNRLVMEYCAVHPSRSWTLNRLGDRFVDYLGGRSDLKNRRFMVDLARLEQAICQVFEERESAPLTPEQVALVPMDAWEHTGLKPIAALRLLAVEYPVHWFLKSVLEEDYPRPSLRRKDGWIVVFRQHYTVWRMPLERAQYELLLHFEQGHSLAEALGDVTRRYRRVGPEQIFRWFQSWVTEGFFQSISS
jgi:hypothetical protein